MSVSRKLKAGDICNLLGTNIKVVLREYDSYDHIWYVECPEYGSMTAMSRDLVKVKEKSQ
jgi:hypothetical protein